MGADKHARVRVPYAPVTSRQRRARDVLEGVLLVHCDKPVWGSPRICFSSLVAGENAMGDRSS